MAHEEQALAYDCLKQSGDEQPSIRKFQTHIAQMIFVREASQRHRIALLRLRSLSWKE